MRGWVGVVVVVALLIVGWVGYARPDLFPDGLDMPRLIYLLMALLLVSGAAYGFSNLKFDGRRAFINLVVWLGLIAAIALVYIWIR